MKQIFQNTILVKKIICIFLIVIWLIVIFLLSSMNSDESNLKSEMILSRIIILFTKQDYDISSLNNLFRKILHVGVYFILTVLIIKILKFIIINKIKLSFVTIFLCLIFSLFDEYHQTFVGRNGNLLDVLIDLIGTGLAIILYLVIEQKKYDKI